MDGRTDHINTPQPLVLGSLPARLWVRHLTRGATGCACDGVLDYCRATDRFVSAVPTLRARDLKMELKSERDAAPSVARGCPRIRSSLRTNHKVGGTGPPVKLLRCPIGTTRIPTYLDALSPAQGRSGCGFLASLQRGHPRLQVSHGSSAVLPGASRHKTSGADSPSHPPRVSRIFCTSNSRTFRLCSFPFPTSPEKPFQKSKSECSHVPLLFFPVYGPARNLPFGFSVFVGGSVRREPPHCSPRHKRHHPKRCPKARRGAAA